MSKTGRPNYRRGQRGRPKAQRHITVRSVRRESPDLRKLSRAVIALALREAEAEAEARAAQTEAPHPRPATDAGSRSGADAEASHD